MYVRGLAITTATIVSVAGIVSVSGCCSSPSRGVADGDEAAAERRFELVYEATISGFPAGAEKARIWLPLPVSDEAQSIEAVAVEAPFPHRVSGGEQYGNRFVYIEADAPLPAEIPVKISVAVERKEVSSVSALPGAPSRDRLLAGDQLAPLSDEAKSRADEATRGRDGNEAKAQGIYDRVLADVSYDKSGSGWGQGNLSYVCDVGKGNCSDFHTLFIAMARTESIPALFEIGFPLPADQGEGEIGGYHCWAWYEATDGSWRPVDASEADKDPERAEYFFGTLCENRIAFSRGRDLQLEPRQDDGPVNFLVYPYVEIDGKAGVATIEKSFRFKNL